MSEPQVFTADSLPKALAKVKAALGPDAIILGTRTLTGGVLKSARVEITATIDSPTHHPRAASSVQPRAALPDQPRAISDPSRARSDQTRARKEAVFAKAPTSAPLESAPIHKTPLQYGPIQRAPLPASSPEARTHVPTGPIPWKVASPTSPERRTNVATGFSPWNAATQSPRPEDARAARSPRRLADSTRIGLDQPLIDSDFERRLIENEVSEELARQLLHDAFAHTRTSDRLSDEEKSDLIRRAIARLIPTTGGHETSDATTQRIVLIGPAGAGKTTSIAKLAAQLRLKHGRRVVLICADQHRLGASAQLRRFGELIGVQVESVADAAQMKTTLREIDQHGPATVLVDTPGVGLREAARLARLHALVRAARPTSIDLALPACLKLSTQRRYAEWFAELKPSGLLLTHLDDALGFGVVLNAAAKLGLKLSYLSAGQSVPKDLEVACSAKIANVLCPPI